MKTIARILHNKYHVFDNHLRTVGHHVLVHIVVAIGILIFIWGGGLFIFHWVFGFLKDHEPFGPPLIHRLMSMVLVAFFSMLIFSNLIITLSTTYVSREIEFFMTLPLRMGQIFWSKFLETTIYSSWAFLVMAMPVFVAYGQALGAAWSFYPALLLLMLPFTIIPASIGALITMVISAYVPARRARTLAFVVGGVSIALAVLLIRMMGGKAMRMGGTDSEFGALMVMLNFGARPWLPNVWMVRGMLAALGGDWLRYLYWLAMLLSTALMFCQVCAWLVRPLYYRGWALARDFGSPARTGRWTSIFDRMDPWLRFLPLHTRALVGKDMRVFWRDPVQWSQLLILFSLLVIYVVNVGAAFPTSDYAGMITAYWKARVSFINMGAACFILSILSTRFMYPLLSLEGKEFWIIGLAPMKRDALIWQKYWLCWAAAITLTESVVLFSCWAMNADAEVLILSVVTVLVLSFGLTSLAIGLGAMTPNFREDNPARIANGLGGTVNVVVSLLYIATVLGLEGVVFLAGKAGQHINLARWNWHLAGCAAALVAVHFIVIFVPMWLGLRRWRNMEF
ncbi:MAG: hypothetical protein NTX50_26170 [Candidatus Sumerlaeota bacterium]|nr:hypothetical protein [Candidatus Sumerlaeota bacterium]